MNAFAALAAKQRETVLADLALRLNMPAFMVEKDFWVCWLLARIFATPVLGAECVFKGGTSLSKVFGAIQRFSEDVDLSISPATLGWQESDLDGAPSVSMRQKRMKKVEADCAVAVRERFQPELEATIAAILGQRETGNGWLVFEMDTVSHSPVLLFHYPAVMAPGEYIAPLVKIEFGSLTDQRPTGRHRIAAFIEQAAPGVFGDTAADVVALELERTFWEKATILHAEYHRPAEKPIPPRFARHYADFAGLWRHPAGKEAARRFDLLERVRLHKSRFFSSSWAHYDTAIPGTLRLVPPELRNSELRRDYSRMEPMFLTFPLSFDDVLQTLCEAEAHVNAVSRPAGPAQRKQPSP